MTNIYLVMDDGEYPSIHAALSTREKAEAFADRQTRGGEPAMVVEWPVDAEDPRRPIVFRVFLYHPSGSAPRWGHRASLQLTKLLKPKVVLEQEDGRGARFGPARYWLVDVWAHDREEAMRRGAELIAPVARAAGIDDLPIPEGAEVDW